MSNLRRIREAKWEEVEAEEMRLLRETTPRQGILDYLALRSEFEAWLQRDETVYGAEYIARLVRLQEQFRRLEESKGDHMEKLIRALIDLQTRLEEAGIPSAAIGGLALGAWGKARLTRDADLKILLRRDERQRLLKLLEADYRSLNADPDEMLRRNGIVFVLNSEGARIDIMLEDTEFDAQIIARAQLVEIMPGRQVRVCSPEDLIVLKMLASRPQDWVDVETVIRKQAENLDEGHILKSFRLFEQLIDDSTLISSYQRIRERARRDV